jgi:DNA-binding CsgD family transcriptional regulator
MSDLFYSASFESLIDSIPSLIWFKDLEFKYIGCNKRLLQLIRIPRREYLYEKNDYDLPWEKYADIYRTHDKAVIENDKINNFILPGNTYDRSNNVLIAGRVAAFRDKTDKIIGIAGSAACITNAATVEVITKLFHNDIDAFGITPGAHHYHLGEDFSSYGLSRREAQCLFYLIRGKTTKGIANKLNLSRRTVEHYIEAIKNKFNCCNKSDLIEKSIEIGFVSFLPGSYLKDFI